MFELHQHVANYTSMCHVLSFETFDEPMTMQCCQLQFCSQSQSSRNCQQSCKQTAFWIQSITYKLPSVKTSQNPVFSTYSSLVVDSSKSNKSLTEQKKNRISVSQGNFWPTRLKHFIQDPRWFNSTENRHRAIETMANVNKSVPHMVKVSHSSSGEST